MQEVGIGLLRHALQLIGGVLAWAATHWPFK